MIYTMANFSMHLRCMSAFLRVIWEGLATRPNLLKKGNEGQRRLEGRSKEAFEKQRPQIEAYETLCAELGREPGDVALAWLLHQPAMTAPSSARVPPTNSMPPNARWS